MSSKLVVLKIFLVAATALGAALPRPGNDPSNLTKYHQYGGYGDPSKQSLSKLNRRDYVITNDVYWSNVNTTEEYSQATDDAWAEVQLEFPMTIFDKSSSKVYFSMNGLISLSNPGQISSLPPKNLPIDPANCGSSCIPDNTLALLWQDLYIPPKTPDLGVNWVYHEPSTSAPQLGHHYHIFWTVCQKGVPIDKPDSEDAPPCGNATRTVQLNYYEKRPGMFYITWSDIPDDLKDPFIVGAQAYPKYLSGKYPGVYPGYPYKQGCLILDTQKDTAIVEDPAKC
ncbi:hypothetical protein ABW21_db0205922 [Orbilia brochopaga]|nr:hypothetical protein ABW21_db0205922 [Drechslerella brochopaga]